MQATPTQDKPKKGKRQLLADLFQFYDSTTTPTPEYLDAVEKKYDGDTDAMLTDVLKFYEPDAEVTPEYLAGLYSKYGIDKQQPKQQQQPGTGGYFDEKLGYVAPPVEVKADITREQLQEQDRQQFIQHMPDFEARAPEGTLMGDGVAVNPDAPMYETGENFEQWRTRNTPEIKEVLPDRSGAWGAAKDVLSRGYNAAVPNLLQAAGNLTEFAGDAVQMAGGTPADDKFTDRWAESLRGTAKSMSAYVSPEGAVSILDDPTSLRAWLGTGIEALATVGQIAATGGGGAALAVGGTLGLSSIYDAADAAGVDDSQKVIMGATLAPAIALLEKAGISDVLKSPAVARMFIKEIVKEAGGEITEKTAVKGIAAALPRVLKAATTEGITEGAQTTLEEGAKIFSDAGRGAGKPVGAGNYGTLTEGTGQALTDLAKKAAVGGTVGAVVGGGFGAVVGKGQVQTLPQQTGAQPQDTDVLQPVSGQPMRIPAETENVQQRAGNEAKAPAETNVKQVSGAWEAVTDRNGQTVYRPKGSTKPKIDTEAQPEIKAEAVTVGKSSYTVAKTDEGYTVTNAKTGKELTNPEAVNYKAAVKAFEAIEKGSPGRKMFSVPSLTSENDQVQPSDTNIREGTQNVVEAFEAEQARQPAEAPTPEQSAPQVINNEATPESQAVKDFIRGEGILNEDGAVNHDILNERLNSQEFKNLEWTYDLSEQDVTALKLLANGREQQPTAEEADTGGKEGSIPGTPQNEGGSAAEGKPAAGSTGNYQPEAGQPEPEVTPASRYDQERAAIQEKRKAIQARIKQKSVGQLNSGLDPALIIDYAELAGTYVSEGVVGVKEVVAKLKEEHKALFADSPDLTDDDIKSILKQADITAPEPEAATKDRRHTQRLLASPDLSQEFKAGITEQDKKYIPITNAINDAEAETLIEFKGLELVSKDALNSDNSMHPATRALLRDKLIVKYDELGTKALKDGDEATAELYFDKAEQVTSAKVERGTLLGQELQSYRVAAAATPERVLYNTRRQVDKTRNEELKNVKSKLGRKSKSIAEINKETIAEALEAGHIKNAIRKAIKEDGINVAAVVKKHYTVADATGEALADKLVKLSRLSGQEAQELADLIKTEFAAMATRRKQQLLKQTLTPKELLNPKQARQLHEKIIELSNLGALSEQQFADLYADKMGLPKLTPEQTANILKLAEKAQKAPEGLPKNKALHELLKYQEGIKGFASVDLLKSVWYANVLSGYSTQFINVFANTNQALGELYVAAAKNPKAAPHLLNGLLQGFTRGRWEMLNVLATGEGPVKGGKINAPNALEHVKFRGGNWNPFNYLKYVTRTMEGADTFFYHGLKEMRAHELAYSKAKAAGLDKPNKQIWQDVTETLFKTSERKAAAEQQAAGEGLTGRDYKRRVYELMEQSRPVAMQEDSHGFAAKGTFNYDPEGTLGYLTDTVAQVTRNVKLAGYIVPFTRIISNVANEYINWSPYGLLRAATGKTGNLLTGDSTRTYAKEYTPEERAKLLIKSGTGILAATALYAFSAPGEDGEQPVIEITATGPDSRTAQTELAGTGWQKYSIRVNDTWYSYQNTPLAIPFSIIGRIRDDEKYTGHSLEDEGYATKAGVYLLNTMQYFTDMTFLKGASEFLGALSSSNPDQAGNYLKRTAANVGKSFVVPNLFTQVSREIQAVTDTPMKDAPDMLGKVVRDMPIARNHLNDMVNSLGEPVTPNTDRITSEQKESTVWDLIVKNRAWIGKPRKGSVIVYDQTTGNERGITDQEYYNFCRLRGQLIKERIQEQLPELQEMDKEEVQDIIQKIKTEATKEAKVNLMLSRS